MRRTRSWTVVALAALALVALAGGCDAVGVEESSPWEPLVSGRLTGDEPTTLDLGVHELGEALSLGWELSGPENPPVTLKLKIERADGSESWEILRSPRSDAEALSRKDGSAMNLSHIEPGAYRIFFSQRFPQGQGPGYDIDFTIYTLR